MDEERSAAGPGALDAARQRRADLHDVLIAVERAIAVPAGVGAVVWAEGVAGTLTRLGAELDAHVAVTEGPDGLYQDLLDVAPRLATLAHRLGEEHAELAVALKAAAADVDRVASAGDAAAIAGVRETVLSLLGAFARHRQLGADLVWEAYEVDIGGG